MPRNDPDHFPQGSLTSNIIGGFYAVYRQLGFGFSEHVYSVCLQRELEKRGLNVQRELSVPVYYDGEVAVWQRLDMVVNSTVVVENKTGERWPSGVSMQLLNYLRCTRLEVGLVLHFGPSPNFKRLVFTNGRKRINDLP